MFVSFSFLLQIRVKSPDLPDLQPPLLRALRGSLLFANNLASRRVQHPCVRAWVPSSVCAQPDALTFFPHMQYFLPILLQDTQHLIERFSAFSSSKNLLFLITSIACLLLLDMPLGSSSINLLLAINGQFLGTRQFAQSVGSFRVGNFPTSASEKIRFTRS